MDLSCVADYGPRSYLDSNARHHRVYADQLWDPECGTVDALDKFMDLMTEAGLVREAQRFVEGSRQNSILHSLMLTTHARATVAAQGCYGAMPTPDWIR